MRKFGPSPWYVVVFAAIVGCISPTWAQAQTQPGTLPTAVVQPGDTYQAVHSLNQRIRMLPSLQALRTRPVSQLYRTTMRPSAATEANTPQNSSVSALTTTRATLVNYFPSDLTYGGGWNGLGYLQTATQFMAFLNFNNCPSCWATDQIGDPVGLLGQYITNLNNSVDIHITNQYVGTRTAGRYPLGSPTWSVQFALPSTMTDADAQAAVHSVALANGNKAGAHYMYHLFLPPGQNICFDNTYAECYSPSNPNTFVFCGYHSSVSFGDVGTIFYSVEPYSYNGCYAGGQDALSAQVSVLGHEIFETITDPYPGYGWVAVRQDGQEVGDLCAWNLFAHVVGATTYITQLEYSNATHSCRNE